MPVAIAIIAAAIVAVLLVRSGIVTGRLLVAMAYGVVGGVIGLLILRYLVGPLGPWGAGLGAVIGAVVLLYLAQRLASSGEE